MKAISLLQPWATLVIEGHKKIETRNWSTSYRGPLLIHAGKSKAAFVIAMEPSLKKYIPDFNALPFGQILGKVYLDKILRIEDFDLDDILMNELTLENKAFGNYASGRYGWVFTEPVKFEQPIPARGMLNLWEYPIEL